jgi:glucose-6-phosphate isomerase
MYFTADAQALVRFAAHIQQVDMESNGKRVTADGAVMPYACGEIVFGEPGTNGQHSFYQLLHQGRVVPAEFIGFSKSPNPVQLAGEVVSNHDELMSNFFAQPDALAMGKTVPELVAEGVPPHLHAHKEFPGNRPSLSLLFPELTAFTCGQLLALYEHRVAVQGFVWGLNSFDQWGVELGKVLASKVRTSLSTARAAMEQEGGGDSSSNGASTPSAAAASVVTSSGFNPATSLLLQKYLNAGK